MWVWQVHLEIRNQQIIPIKCRSRRPIEQITRESPHRCRLKVRVLDLDHIDKEPKIPAGVNGVESLAPEE